MQNKRIKSLFLCTFIILYCFQTNIFAQSKQLKFEQNWWQYGFKIGANFTPKHDISKDINSSGQFGYSLTNLFCGEFGAYFRAGKYVYGEIGFGYQFQKNRFKPTYYTADEVMPVEFRYLQIPVKAVAYLPVSKLVALMAHVGIIYQPLIKVTENHIGLSKDNVRRHNCYFTTGLGIKIHFISIDFAYRKSFLSYFSDRKSTKEGYFNVQIGVQL